jgi:hypothetical protein
MFTSGEKSESLAKAMMAAPLSLVFGHPLESVMHVAPQCHTRRDGVRDRRASRSISVDVPWNGHCSVMLGSPTT